MMYKDYLEERTDKRMLETEHGFAIYSFTQDSVYIEDIYVQPDFRQSSAASEMADTIAEVAKQRGIRVMLGSVVPTTKGSTTSLKVLLAYGFKLDSSANNFIVMKKEII